MQRCVHDWLCVQDSTTVMSNVLAGITPAQAASTVFRSPQRITITLPYSIYRKLLERSDQEGRSLSNLSAFLLESALSDQQLGREK